MLDWSRIKSYRWARQAALCLIVIIQMVSWSDLESAHAQEVLVLPAISSFPRFAENVSVLDQTKSKQSIDERIGRDQRKQVVAKIKSVFIVGTYHDAVRDWPRNHRVNQRAGVFFVFRKIASQQSQERGRFPVIFDDGPSAGHEKWRSISSRNVNVANMDRHEKVSALQGNSGLLLANSAPDQQAGEQSHAASPESLGSFEQPAKEQFEALPYKARETCAAICIFIAICSFAGGWRLFYARNVAISALGLIPCAIGIVFLQMGFMALGTLG